MHKFRDKVGNVYRDKVAIGELHDFLNNAELDIFKMKLQEWIMEYNLGLISH